MPRSGNLQPAIDNAEHIGPSDTGDNIEAKRVANYAWNGSEWQRQSASSSGINVDTGFQKDIFGYQVIVQPYNQVELRGDDTDWADFVTETNANGGDTTQGSGLLTLATSTAATGSAILASNDNVRYRPGVGVYGAGTAIFTTGVAGANQYFGLGTDTSFANGVAFGYKGTSFGILYMRGGSEVSFTAQADWDDPCLGAATSSFTRDGATEALDPTKDNLYRFEAGLFGFAGWKAQVWSPDNGWITVYTHKHINTGTVPVFTLNTFKMVASAVKTSGATNISIKTQCWGAGTGTPLMRMGATITDRTLAQAVRAVLAAQKPNGDYINVDATAGGNLKASIEEVEAGVVMPVSGTVTANLSATDNAVLDDIALNQTDGTQVANPTAYAQRVDEASATVTYIGEATPGSATSGALWRVKKLDSTTGLVVTWADGNNSFDNVWDNRASLTYS